MACFICGISKKMEYGKVQVPLGIGGSKIWFLSAFRPPRSILGIVWLDSSWIQKMEFEYKCGSEGAQ